MFFKPGVLNHHLPAEKVGFERGQIPGRESVRRILQPYKEQIASAAKGTSRNPY